jgi:hypothetical protein
VNQSLIKETQKQHLKKKLLKEIPELMKSGWKKFHIDLLKKHFTFYIGLANSTISPKNNDHKQFKELVKNWRTAKPKNVHEEIYLNYIKFYNKKNLDNINKKKITDPVWKQIEEFPPGAKPYTREMIEKINTEYWGESWDSWFDDWKYR